MFTTASAHSHFLHSVLAVAFVDVVVSPVRIPPSFLARDIRQSVISNNLYLRYINLFIYCLFWQPWRIGCQAFSHFGISQGTKTMLCSMDSSICGILVASSLSLSLPYVMYIKLKLLACRAPKDRHIPVFWTGIDNVEEILFFRGQVVSMFGSDEYLHGALIRVKLSC